MKTRPGFPCLAILVSALALFAAAPGAADVGDQSPAVCVANAPGEDLGLANIADDMKDYPRRGQGPYASVHALRSPDESEGCDAVVRIRLKMGFSHNRFTADVLSGSTRRLLYRTSDEGISVPDFASAMYGLFSSGGEVNGKLKAERQAAAAPPPPPAYAAAPAYAPAYAPPAAPSVSREDMQKIAEDAARKASDETARRQTPAVAAPQAQEKAIVSDVDAPRYHDASRPDDVALVVGVEKYNDLPDAQFAERDAKAVRDHLLALGFAPRNVMLLTGARASRSGIATAVERKLPAMTKPGSTVFFYYSGHGAPDPATGKAYLLPADGDPQYLDDSAYATARLYSKLGALKAKRVLVVLDSCFSGGGGRSVLPKGTRPLVTKIDEGAVPPKVVSLTASQSNEIAGAFAEQGHGVFTYYFLKGLSNGRRSLRELYEYAKPNVEDAARLQNRAQSPVLIGADTSL
jgi:hypothetical protein